MEKSGKETNKQAGLNKISGNDVDLVSVVIPVYNGESYIHKCLECVSGQTYEKIEILVIDDGSDDESWEILKGARMKDPRITVFRQAHRGVSAARNRGIEESKGKYLVFCDADDYFEPRYVEQMMVHSTGKDLVVCGYFRVREGKEKYVYRDSSKISREELYERALCSNDIGGSCWNKLFRLDIITQNGLRFQENIFIGEDTLFCVSYYRLCKEIFYVGDALYNYCFHEESLMKSVVDGGKEFDYRMISCLAAADGLLSAAEDKEETRCCISYRRIRSTVWLLYQMAKGRYRSREVFRHMKLIVRESLGGYRQLSEQKRCHDSKIEKMAVYGMAVSPKLVYFPATVLIRIMGKKLHNKYLR